MSIISIAQLTHRFGDRLALDDFSLSVQPGQIHGFLGPNGSGKTTLFRILATLIPVQRGHVTILGVDPAVDAYAVRRQIGVVFQSPSLDKQLTARENLYQQGRLYGLGGADLRARVDAAMQSVQLADRAAERVEKFSGGMRRRVEVAKGLLHRPRILLLDEPSTGLDPIARIEMWKTLARINQQDGVTVLVTTHLMEEADRCTQIAVMADGKLLAADAPAALKECVGGDMVTVTSDRPTELRLLIRERFGMEAKELAGVLRIEISRGHEFLPRLVEAAPGLVNAASVGKPTLEDVFIQLTGRRLADETNVAER